MRRLDQSLMRDAHTPSFHLIPRDKKLLRSSKVRAWLRDAERKIAAFQHFRRLLDASLCTKSCREP